MCYTRTRLWMHIVYNSITFSRIYIYTIHHIQHLIKHIPWVDWDLPQHCLVRGSTIALHCSRILVPTCLWLIVNPSPLHNVQRLFRRSSSKGVSTFRGVATSEYYKSIMETHLTSRLSRRPSAHANVKGIPTPIMRQMNTIQPSADLSVPQSGASSMGCRS